MCVMSVMSDYYGRYPMDRWNRRKWEQFQETIPVIEELDRVMGEPDCLDPAKAEWMKRVEERLTQLEQQKQDQPAP